MAQITIYIPDDLAEKVRAQADEEGMSLSAYMTALARRMLEPERWPDEFVELYGAWEGEFPDIEELPPDSREPLK